MQLIDWLEIDNRAEKDKFAMIAKESELSSEYEASTTGYQGIIVDNAFFLNTKELQYVKTIFPFAESYNNFLLLRYFRLQCSGSAMIYPFKSFRVRFQLRRRL